MRKLKSEDNSDFLTPVARSTLTANVCRKLVSHLLRGDWQEGDRLPPERELGQRLGVGRASLREALKALEIMGMIESRVGEGTFACHRSEFLSRPMLWAITGSTQSEIREIIEARLTMETALAGFAAERATADDLREIDQYIGAMEAAKNDPAAFLEADINFHLAVARAAHNRILFNAVQLIRNLMRQWMKEALESRGTSELALQQHKTIFLAITQRDKDAACAAVNAHLEAMGALLHH
jgi:GntR family transcriptional repressor for pyruvate dehydrogenase complex